MGEGVRSHRPATLPCSACRLCAVLQGYDFGDLTSMRGLQQQHSGAVVFCRVCRMVCRMQYRHVQCSEREGWWRGVFSLGASSNRGVVGARLSTWSGEWIVVEFQRG